MPKLGWVKGAGMRGEVFLLATIRNVFALVVLSVLLYAWKISSKSE